jgi:hydroxyacylglutathione hydrolase
MKIKTVKTGSWKQNCFIVLNDNNEALIIDPGDDSAEIIKAIDEDGITPLAIVNTHAHFDHIGAVSALKKKYNIPFYLHKNESSLLKRGNLYKMAFMSVANIEIPTTDVFITNDTTSLKIKDFDLIIHQTPGHTSGGICIQIENYLFVGDTILTSNLVPKNLPEENIPLLQKSFAYLDTLDPHLTVMPGHGGPTELGAKIKLLLNIGISAE